MWRILAAAVVAAGSLALAASGGGCRTPAPAAVPEGVDAPRAPVVFKVSDVEKATEPLAVIPQAEILQGLAGDRLEAAPVINRPFVETIEDNQPLHPFVFAAHMAFAEHRPLVISPDMVWTLILQGLATHINANPEKFRGLLVSHEGKETLVVRRDGFVLGSPDNDWRGVFAEFATQIVAKANDPLPGMFAARFSSSTPDTLAARQVILMKAGSPYYNYVLLTLCGIPEIILEGTPGDWRRIKAMCANLDAYDLKDWRKLLDRALDQFIAASEGHADRKCWQSFYKCGGGSGGTHCTGWIHVFFPYDGAGERRKLSAWGKGFLTNFRDDDIRGIMEAPYLNDFPTGVTTQPFLWKYQGKDIPMFLQAGFLGCTQYPKTLALRPEVVWLVGHEPQTEQEKQIFSLRNTVLIKLGKDWPDDDGLPLVPANAKLLVHCRQARSVMIDDPSLLTSEVARALTKLPRLKKGDLILTGSEGDYDQEAIRILHKAKLIPEARPTPPGELQPMAPEAPQEGVPDPAMAVPQEAPQPQEANP